MLLKNAQDVHRIKLCTTFMLQLWRIMPLIEKLDMWDLIVAPKSVKFMWRAQEYQ